MKLRPEILEIAWITPPISALTKFSDTGSPLAAAVVGGQGLRGAGQQAGGEGQGRGWRRWRGGRTPGGGGLVSWAGRGRLGRNADREAGAKLRWAASGRWSVVSPPSSMEEGRGGRCGGGRQRRRHGGGRAPGGRAAVAAAGGEGDGLVAPPEAMSAASARPARGCCPPGWAGLRRSPAGRRHRCSARPSRGGLRRRSRRREGCSGWRLPRRRPGAHRRPGP